MEIETSLTAALDYDPWGQRSWISGTVDSSFGYAGYFRHAASGLDLTLFRAYDPELGRWLSRDPILESGGLNVYGYVGNSGVNGVDVWGLYSSADEAAIAAIKNINPVSVAQNTEYSGWIYQNVFGQYYYTAPVPGDDDSSNPGPRPEGMLVSKVVGAYHTHGEEKDSAGGDEEFSPKDLQLADKKQMPIWLGTPRNAIKKYTPSGTCGVSGQQSILQGG